MFKLRALAIVGVVTLAGCVSPPAPTPVPRPAPAPPPPPPVAQDWSDRPLTPGDWVYRQDARGPIAYYGIGGQGAALTIRCDRAAAQVIVSRPGGTAGLMTLVATNASRSYAAALTGGAPLYVAATLVARDPQLDALVFSRGRFLVRMEGAEDIIVPSWPEFARVVEDCR